MGSGADFKSNQIKSLLLSHHHSTSALVSEILMSVLQTVQKNNRQFTYGQIVQKKQQTIYIWTDSEKKKKKKQQTIYIWTDSAKKQQTIYIWTDSAKKQQTIYIWTDSAKKQQTIYIWTDSAKKQQTIYIWTDSAKKQQTIYIWTDSAKKLHWSIYSAPDSAKKTTTAIYIWTDSAKKQQQFTYGQYIFTDCTEDNVQNTHTYTLSVL